jgi:hypothetical protein
VPKIKSAIDSSLEGAGFELSVPHENGSRSELSSFVYVTKTVSVITSPSRSRRPVSTRVIRLETSKSGVKRGDASSIRGQAVGGA